MKNRYRYLIIILIIIPLLFQTFITCSEIENKDSEDKGRPALEYTISITEPAEHFFHVDLHFTGWIKDTIDLKMPDWTPGYYLIMDYEKYLENFQVKDKKGNDIPATKPDDNTWQIVLRRNKPFTISYDIKADRRFVANNFLDTTHAYIVPAATFLYINNHVSAPVRIKIIPCKGWNQIATGLDSVPGKTNEFFAPDFDNLYDCPILIGSLEEFPPFDVNGIKHRFIGFNPGSFDRIEFMTNLKKVVRSGIDIIGDIPYRHYTFIAIGPGFGGIEHSNNTTVSFAGRGLDKREAMNRMMSYLAHEYFHNFNVKRIRPFELGPFDYNKENRTNLLWMSEGLTVYYEYLITKRAGLINEEELFNDLEGSINAYENDPGRFFQSLTQASFNTWTEGPFGRQGRDDRSISCYDKGAIIGLILDFKIRNVTQNKKSLDDVMRLLYSEYYKRLNRGFTDAEFQEVCESVAGISLSPEFEYISTIKGIDYNIYLGYAGLRITEKNDPASGKRRFSISRLDNINPDQELIFHSWMGE
jgi:predicted metalloprotease with PDZ domain